MSRTSKTIYNKSSHNQLDSPDYHWRFWATVPIYPYSKRLTIRREVLKDTIWTFDQLQGIFYVVVPIRMTVVRLAAGGLLVYAPVSPTKQCLELVQDLVEQYGDVKYIILPTISGLEHKNCVGPFARKFDQATVYVAPKQWSFPLDLPLSWLGFPPKRTKILPADSSQTPFADEFDYAILDDIDLRLGQFSEVAFFHKRSQTLLVTDIIVSIPELPPEIIEQDLLPLLFHARENAQEPIRDTPENRIKGWHRICLFAMYFRASVLSIPTIGKIFLDAWRSPNKSPQTYWGLYPFIWQPNWQDAFDKLRGHGRLLVAPILQTLILNRAPQQTLGWVDKIANWNFNQIIPCHFAAPITTSPQEFRQSFSFLQGVRANSIRADEGLSADAGSAVCPPHDTKVISQSNQQHTLPEMDLKTLQKIDAILSKPGLIPPPQD